MESRWHIELLGRLRATRGDTVVTRFRARKTGALLAYLAYHLGRPHPRETLIELLWPESEPQTGRNNLRRELSSLRRQLQPPGVPSGGVIIADRGCVHLNPVACTTDAIAFEKSLRVAAEVRSSAECVTWLTEAAELYRGELLPGYFEEWVLPERQRLAEMHLQALAQLTAHLEAVGDYDGALQWARRAVAADPLREEGHHELIRLLQAAGHPAAAFREYQEWKRLLEAELGTAPSVEIRTLVRALEGSGDERRGSRAKIECPVSPPLPLHTASTSPPSHLPGSLSPPTGTVTFLLAEIDEALALESCRELLRSALLAHGGHELPAARSMLQAAFARASDALAAAMAMHEVVRTKQNDGAGETVRLALHTAEVGPDKQAQHSPALQHATRLLLAAHPGQILVSEKSTVLLRDDLASGVHLLDLGPYRLRDASPPERLFQVCFADLPAREFPPPHALPAHGGTLPLQFTRFFGREAEIARLRDVVGSQPSAHGAYLLTDGQRPTADCSRLITLTGPGGSGKTRLALEVAGELRTAFHGAVWFVPLQDLTDARLIPDKLLDALRLPRSPQLQPLEQATAFLSRQPSLLLLDNFEHLMPHGAPLVQTLLEQVPTLTCLVTSRQRMNLAGEQEFPVVPLPVPDFPARDRDHARPFFEQEQDDPSALSHYPSVRLFVDRVQAVRPDFQVTRTNVGAVAGLCARLEGLPLALELAAARAGVLTPQQMLERLSQRFELLVTTQRGAAPRHRSLWAALEWSYQLLSPELQQFFARLSVFQGGWSMEAAEVVCQETNALAYLEQLRECSLVQAAEAGEEMRFRLLETLREYGAEQLGMEERGVIALRHASYYLALGERAEPEVKRGEQMAWLDRLERDVDNLRAALSWLEASGRIQEALRLGGALHLFWEIRGHPAEGLARLKALVALPDAQARTSARAKALTAAGTLATVLGEPETTLPLYEASLEIARELGDRWNTAFALTCMASALNHLGRLEAARPLWEEALPIWREINDPWGIACTLTGLAWTTRDLRDYGRTRGLLRECLTLRRQLGDQWGSALVLCRMGSLARDAGDYEEARSLWQESLARAQEVGNRGFTCQSLQGLGQLAHLEGDLPTARAVLEQSLPLARETGNQQGVGQTLIQLAEVAADQGDLDTADAYLEESLAFWRLAEDKVQIARSLRVQGRIALRRGDPVTAGRCFAESLAMRQAAKNTSEISRCLEDLAELAHLRRHEERAARLLGAAAALREEIGTPRAPVECAEFDRRLGEARSALGEAEFAAAWSAGRAMSSEQAIAEVLFEAPADSVMPTAEGYS